MTNLKNFEFLRSQQRGHAQHGWLDSKHSFSFANYYNPHQMHFSDLRVINDDKIDGGHGFPTHPHDNMEIFTYVLEGSLAHKDSMGNGEEILPGDVQIMSAGRGIRHSEYNPLPNTTTRLLQIWIFPNKKGGEPTYQQKNFTKEEKRGQLKLIISDDESEGSLKIYQNAKIYSGLFNGEEKGTLKTKPGRSYYVHVVQGSVNLNELPLLDGDAVKIFDTDMDLVIDNGENAEVLIFDLNTHKNHYSK